MAAAVVPLHNVVRQYVKHQSSQARPSDATLDIGAYEYSAGSLSQCDLNMDAAVNIVDIQGLINLVLGFTVAPPGFGDLNHDGSVNIADIQGLVNTVIGVSSCPL